MISRNKIFIFSFLFFVSFCTFSNNKKFHLYINRGIFATVKNTTFPFLAFNKDSTFNQLNETIIAVIGDTISLVVINNDSVHHGFAIKNSSVTVNSINPGDSVQLSFSSAVHSAFIYYDNLQFPTFNYLGLSGIIYFKPVGANKNYFWNIKEHQTSYSTILASGGAVNWNNYQPDYYTINSKSFPDLQIDSLAKINAHVGDTLYIVAANTGHSAHSLHFHGFHTESIFTDAKNLKNSWVKDTWGMFSMDIVVMKMVPDKIGKYSVHDHNLVAVTGGNTHPNGMFTIMEINP